MKHLNELEATLSCNVTEITVIRHVEISIFFCIFWTSEMDMFSTTKLAHHEQAIPSDVFV